MSPRYTPLLTDGEQTRSLTDWKKQIHNQGLILEPEQTRNIQTYNVLTVTPGGTKPIKQLRKIGAENITKIVKS